MELSVRFRFGSSKCRVVERYQITSRIISRGDDGKNLQGRLTNLEEVVVFILNRGRNVIWEKEVLEHSFGRMGDTTVEPLDTSHAETFYPYTWNVDTPLGVEYFIEGRGKEKKRTGKIIKSKEKKRKRLNYLII